MATYLQGVTDKITSVRPPQPNLQFESQLLSARQSKYDQGHKQLSDMYGKILNAGLTRESNIEARDDFFKLIDGDLKKIAGIDLSKQSNVNKAQNVFTQVYDNDYLVKDMVWTKNYQNQLQRAEQYKNCIDPEKCGGEYWDGGMKYMQYKRQEFAETDNKDSLTFENAEFVPYHNIMEKAMVAAKESGLNITKEDIMGDYKVTTKNGRLLETPLTELFDKLYADNPGYQKQFEVESYNERKDWATNQINAGNFKTMQEAEVGYITEQSKTLNEAVNKIAIEIGADNESIDRQLKALEKMKDKGLMRIGDANYVKYVELSQLKGLSDKAKGFAEISQTALKNANNHRVIRNIGHQLDQASGLIKLDAELRSTAKTLSHRDEETLLELDEKAKMRIQHGYNVSLEGVKQKGRLELENVKQQGRLDLAEFKGEGGGGMSIAHTINKRFTKAFGGKGEQAMSEIVAAANKKFDYYTATDLSKKGKNPSDPKRVAAMAHNEKVKTARAKWITEQQAALLDEKGGTTWGKVLKDNPDYNTILEMGGGQVTAGDGADGGGSEATGGLMGLFKKAGEWLSENLGNPLPQREEGEDFSGYNWSDYEPKDVNDMMSFVAEGHTDPAKQKYYKKVAKIGYENLSKEDKKIVNEKLGTRINEVNSAIKAAESGTQWVRTTGTESDGDAGEGKAEKHFKQNDQAALKGKQQLAKKFTEEWLKTIDEDSDEFKSLQKTVHDYLISTGGSTTSGTLTWVGASGETHNIGSLYKDFDEGGSNLFFSAVPLKGGHLKGKGKGSYGKLRGLHLSDTQLDKNLSLDVIKKLVADSNYLGDKIYKTKLRNKSEGVNDYFNSKPYKDAAKKYEVQDETYNGYTESKRDNATDIKRVLRAEMKGSKYFQQFIWEEGTGDFAGKQVYTADDFIDANGRFKYDIDGMTSETIKNGRRLYAEAMDAVYKENGYKNEKPYMPGIGSRLSTTYTTLDPDMLNVDDQGTIKDIRDYLNVMVSADVDGARTGVFRKKQIAQGNFEYMHEGTNDQKNEIINSILSGDLDISSIEFNAIGGKHHPKDGKTGLAKSDWQTMRVAVTGGEVYEFDLNTSHHQTRLLQEAHNGGSKAQMLSDVGRYTYKKGDHLTPEGIKISLDGTGVAVTGDIYSWDHTTDRKVFKDINDYLDPNLLLYQNPEAIEYEIDRIINAISKPYYKEHNPIAE